MKDYRHYIARPWTVKIEFTRGCNLACKFCPTAVLPYSKDKQYLDPDLCRLIAEQVAEVLPDGRIELTMRGEPTLNPDVLKNLEILRQVLPYMQISMFTNGVLFFKYPEMMKELIEAGVNILNIDCYNNTYKRFHDLVLKSFNGKGYAKLEDFRRFSAYKRHPRGHFLRVVNLVPDIQEGEVDVRQIHNNAGNVDPDYLKSLPGYKFPSLPLQKQCARPFRELVVTYDGDLVICCHDWRAECVLGNVNDSTLHDLWYGKMHHEILKSLYKKDRSGKPCNKCDYGGGYRLGFLQDPEEKR